MRSAVVFPVINRIRQNHGLEHATIAVLLERGARTPLAGNASPGGFFVYGRLSTEEVGLAAAEGLRRLQAGRSELAVSPYCGTNLLVGALVGGLISGIIMRRSKSLPRRVSAIAAAVVGASLLGRPLGNMLQRHVTTLAESEGVRITRIGCFKLGEYTIHRVSTTRDTC